MNPRFPIYIPSKGRHDSRLTVKTLNAMGIDSYLVIVEAQEYKKYAAAINKNNILVLDKEYQVNYDAFDKFDMSRSKGSGPARNFAWDHSIANGEAWHWVMDDNIRWFYRWNKNKKHVVYDSACIRAMEDFVRRYSNISMAGPHYEKFAPRHQNLPPFNLNKRIYSCNLIRNDLPYRWRCRYNEDVDLSLRMLKDGWCTVLFYSFLQGKQTTQTMKGGNTDELYKHGTLEKSKMLVKAHPDVAKLVWKWNRWHHHVDYRPFRKNKLKRRPDVVINPGVNNYGLELKRVER